jgi:hypothetical protein
MFINPPIIENMPPIIWFCPAGCDMPYVAAGAQQVVAHMPKVAAHTHTAELLHNLGILAHLPQPGPVPLPADLCTPAQPLGAT